MAIRVTVWGEYRHERQNPKVKAIYPDGMHEAIASRLGQAPGLSVAAAHLDEPEHGLSVDRLAQTDVLTWWGHLAHDEVADSIADRVARRVREGMGFIVLHSGHDSRPFKRLMGTSCDLKWRDGNDREILWVTRPGHRIVQGIEDHFILPAEEMYGEFFDIPEPMETVLISSFTGGEVFRSGCTWTRGAGKIFYFRPGHEMFPTYHDANVLRVIENACHWAAPGRPTAPVRYGRHPAGWLPGV